MSAELTPCPLVWPPGEPRAPRRGHATFEVSSFARVRDGIQRNIELLGGNTGIVVSCNLPIGSDGEPLDVPAPRDTGVAVYWTQLRHAAPALRSHIACDRWRSVLHNLHAIELTLEARRGLSRWGATDLVVEVDVDAELAARAAGGAR